MKKRADVPGIHAPPDRVPDFLRMDPAITELATILVDAAMPALMRANKPHVRMHTKLGAYTQELYYRILRAGQISDDHCPVKWATSAKDAWESAALRMRLGLL